MTTGRIAVERTMELAEELRLAKLRRMAQEHPEESIELIERRVQEELLRRPLAPHGDASGPSVRVRTQS